MICIFCKSGIRSCENQLGIEQFSEEIYKYKLSLAIMKYNNKKFQLVLLIIFFSLFQACDRERPQPRNIDSFAAYNGLSGIGSNWDPMAGKRRSIIGDDDGLGIGLQNRDMWDSDTAGISLPIDYRSQSDPEFTDIFPAAIGGEINYVHSYEAIDTVRTAIFAFKTLGIEDGSIKEIDIKLYIDGDEIVGAFDHVSQARYKDGKKLQTFGLHYVEVPTSLLHHLQDGEVKVRWEVVQLGNSQIRDDFAIDYSDLLLSKYDGELVWQSEANTGTGSHWILLGDSDRFGVRYDNYSNWYPDSAASLPDDNRENYDPYFTDIYPAHVDGIIEYEYSFDIPSDSVISAYFRFYTYGIQDGDHSNLDYNDTDIKLFVNRYELDEAFDSVNQMDSTGVPLHTTEDDFIFISIPDTLLKFVADGNVKVRLEVYQYGSNGELDNFAIDYTNLQYYTQ